MARSARASDEPVARGRDQGLLLCGGKPQRSHTVSLCGLVAGKQESVCTTKGAVASVKRSGWACRRALSDVSGMGGRGVGKGDQR